jgi:hypothetical protein
MVEPVTALTTQCQWRPTGKKLCSHDILFTAPLLHKLRPYNPFRQFENNVLNALTTKDITNFHLNAK